MAARRDDHEAGQTLVELQSFADSATDWLRENWIWPAAAILAVVLVTGLVAGLRGWREHRELQAATAMAAVERDFLARMGAQPGSFTFEEPANPEVAVTARREAADQLLEVSREHEETRAAVLARLEAGQLLADAGNRERALEIWRGILDASDPGPELAGLVRVRIAQAEEAMGNWKAAAEAYAAAGADPAYPLWGWALADAARAYVEAGDRAAAVRLAEQVRAEAPDLALPPHLAAQLEELRAEGQAGGAAS